MKDSSDEWVEVVSGRVRIGTAGDLVPVRMSRWHWHTLRYLEQERRIDVATALGEIRPLAPDATDDQLVMWYVEEALDAVDAEADGGTGGDAAPG